MPPNFRRPARVRLPEPPRGEIVLQAPPVQSRRGRAALMAMLVTVPMMLGMGAMSFTYISRQGGAMTVVFAVLFGGVMLGMLAMNLVGGGMAKKAAINDERRDYQRYLGTVRKQARQVALAQRAAAVFQHPEPDGLWAVAVSARLWERRRTDPDFGHVRIGTGPQRLASALRPPQTAPLEDLDPVSSTALRSLIRTTATVPDLPVVVSLRSYPRVRLVTDDREAGLQTLRAVLASLVTFHPPGDLRVALCVADARRPDWDWVKWLPHAWHPVLHDACGPVRLVGSTMDALAELLGAELTGRPRFGSGTDTGGHLVVVVDGGDLAGSPLAGEGGLDGVTVVQLVPGGQPGPGESGLRLLVDGDRIGVQTRAEVTLAGARDRLDEVAAQTLARQLAGRFTPERQARRAGPVTHGLTELLGIADPHALDLGHLWTTKSGAQRLRVPLGVVPDGGPLEIDFKESAEGGMGPHGLVIGATGSGKSELLRTLVASLALTHSSAQLNFVLVDFKGGATFAGLAELPHTAAVITNLADDLTLVDRMQDSLHGELVRRQELLRSAGNYASVRDYERAREAGRPLEPLPTLMVIIDEFSELLSSQPDFIELFVMIGRLGRSLAVHLLLASQRLEEGRLRGLDSHLSYRIGLRTFSSAESRVVLGVPDAYELPPVPGSAYLRADIDSLIRFKAAYVSGPAPARRVRSAGASAALAATPADRRVVPFGLARTAPAGSAGGPAAGMGGPAAGQAAGQAAGPVGGPAPGPDPAAAQQDALADSMLDVLAGQLVGQGPPPHQVWLPPLAEPPSLDQILPPLAVVPGRGLCPQGWSGLGQLTVPVGIVDQPFEQKRDLLWAQLAGASGHTVVVGGPQSGRSTLVRSLIASLALTHTPAEVQVYCLDFGGGTLDGLAGLPHVGGVAGRMDHEKVSRTVAELMSLLASRELLFREQRIDTMATFRSRRSQEELEERPYGDVFLVVDGWGVLRQEFEPLEESITTLATRGLGYGIHLVLTGNRWMEFRPALRDVLGTRFELRLGDPSDSEIDRRKAQSVPAGVPGRGLSPAKQHFLTAVPRVDARCTADGLADGVAGLVRAVADAWQGPQAPPVRLLPRLVPAQELPLAQAPGAQLVIGIGEADLRPVAVDFAADQHLMAFGDAESGKSGLLRLIAHGVAGKYTREQARIVVADYRRSLLGEISPEHLVGYAGSEAQLKELVGQTLGTLEDRLPGPDVTPAQLRARDWWSGPEVYFLVDDYDLVTGAASNPLAPLAALLPQSRDIGLHLVVVRRSGGAGRALYDPILQRLKEVSAAGLVMSGDRDEGALVGSVRPSAQPPGRGLLVTRSHGVRLVQLGWLPLSQP